MRGVAITTAVLLTLAGACTVPAGAEETSGEAFVARAAAAIKDTILEAVEARGTNPHGEWEDVDTKWCPNKSYYEMIPVYMGTVTTSTPLSFSGDCLQGANTATLSMNATGATIQFTNDGNATGLLCSDSLVLASREKIYLHSNSALGGKSQSASIAAWHPKEHDDVNAHGLHLFLLPCGLLGTLTSTLKTVTLFTEPNMTEANVDFLNYKLMPGGVLTKPLGVFNKTQDIDGSTIPSGSYLAVSRLDGLDTLIMFGTGGVTGHSVTVVKDPTDGVTYCVESTDKTPFGKAYWPPPYGVIRTPFDQWVEQARNASFGVALLPISAELAPKFNESRFWSWFKTVEGMPYGYHT